MLALSALVACSQQTRQPTAPAPSSTASEADAAAASAAPIVAKPRPKASTPVSFPAAAQSPSESRDPAKVVVAWAKAMSLKQWATAYRYWGDHGARSGLTLAQFSANWGTLNNPEFELHPGDTEGGAGSLYYTAPIVLIDGARQTRGELVMRRVNDVDGASAEQLRWHIETLTIAP